MMIMMMMIKYRPFKRVEAINAKNNKYINRTNAKSIMQINKIN